MEGLQNVNISGTGKINGGKFAEVNISGLGQILGDVEANRIEVSGMETIKGRAKMHRFLVSGNGTVEGELEGSELETSGNFKVNGPVKVIDIRNQGRARFSSSTIIKDNCRQKNTEPPPAAITGNCQPAIYDCREIRRQGNSSQSRRYQLTFLL